MTDFDPNDELDTQEAADAYVNWCAENFMRVSQEPLRTYRKAVRCAAWLFVVASSQLHLDDAVERDREALLEQLCSYQQLGRAIERQRQHFVIERLIVLRSSLDCWEPVGEWAEALLTAAKCSIAALVLIELHPLIELWDLPCTDVWALLDVGLQRLAGINAADDLSFDDYAVRPDEAAIAKFTWQRANNLVRHVGAHKLGPN